MNRLLKNKLVICLIIVMFVSVGYIFADDVIVQNGKITGSNLLIKNSLYNFLYFYNNTFFLDNGISMYVDGALSAGNDSGYPVLSLNPEAEYVIIGDELAPHSLGVYGNITADSFTIGNQCYLGVDQYGDAFLDSEIIYIGGRLGIARDDYFVCVDGDFLVTGKIESWGGYDPPYVLYDQQSREEIIERVKKEVSPDKQNGAAMFFNKETKKLETYIASEGKFYDLDGNLIHKLAEVVEPTIKYETVYHFDSTTGEICPTFRAVQEKFQIKEGYAFDDKTGNFISKDTKETVSREEALEIYAASEGKIYDLQHNFVRNVEKNQSTEIAAAENNNSTQINTAENSTPKQETVITPASLNK